MQSIASPMDQDTGKPEVNHSTAKTPENANKRNVQKLESDHQFYKQQIGQFQQKFQNPNVIIQGYEEMAEENQRLNEKVKSLKKTVSEYELDRQTTKTNLAKQEGIWRAKVLQFSKENSDLKKDKKDHDAAFLSAEKSTKLTDEHVAVNGLRQENIVPLKVK